LEVRRFCSDTGRGGERGFGLVEDLADLAGQGLQGEGFLQEAGGYVNRTVVLEGGFGIAGDGRGPSFPVGLPPVLPPAALRPSEA
jgi:hypothetical protein